MERFEGNRGLAAVFGLTGVFMLSLVVVVFWQSYPQFHTLTLGPAVAGVFGLGSFCASALFTFWAAREMSASYTVDELRISRRVWGRETVLAWRDVVRFEELSATGYKAGSNTFGRLRLRGAGGQRLSIRFHFLAEGSHLRARLEPLLAPLRESDLHEIAKNGRSFRTAGALGFIVLAFMAPLFLVGGYSGMHMSERGGLANDRGLRYFSILCAAASPFLAVLGLELLSRKLTIARDRLELRSLFLKRSIPFAGVESIDVKLVNGEGPAVERAKIRAVDGQSITLDSSMGGYRPAMGLLRTHAAAKPWLNRPTDPELA